MAMAVDAQQRQFGGMNFDMPYTASPQFTNPWTSSSGPAHNHSLYAPSHNMNSHMGMEAKPRMPSYANAPLPAAAGSSHMAEVYGQEELLTMTQDHMNQNRLQQQQQHSPGYSNEAQYTTGAPVHSTYATSAPYDTMGYAPAPVRSTYPVTHQDNSRRLSHPMSADSTRSFVDAIDASRGMIAMSQDITPRAIYAPNSRGRGSSSDYGFPQTHSTSSSISSSSTYPSYFGGSVDSSVSDYSGAGSDMESVSSRTLPRPSGLMGAGMPPAPQSMMGQFSSKVSSSTQKKHKCKVCDKRFTRPSSLQTHMYSHTGEKPFSCEVEGCGRHFSVVSNLRRHRKVHKGDARSETSDDHDHHSD